jgi:hypothetical protein
MANIFKKLKNPFHRRVEHRSPSTSTVSLNDNISKSVIPPVVPNQSQDTLVNLRPASLHSSASPSGVDTANKVPIERADRPQIEERSTSLGTPSQQSALAKAGNVAWKGLETALRLLERSADAFPPLKSAVGGLVACLDLTQVSYYFGFDLLDVAFNIHLRQSLRIVKSMKT